MELSLESWKQYLKEEDYDDLLYFVMNVINN